MYWRLLAPFLCVLYLWSSVNGPVWLYGVFACWCLVWCSVGEIVSYGGAEGLLWWRGGVVAQVMMCRLTGFTGWIVQSRKC